MHLYWESIVFSGVAFLILLFLLNKFAFGPLFSVMEKRREIVLAELNEAEKNRKESSQLLNEQKQEMDKAREEAFRLIEEAKQTSSRQADAILKDASSDAERIKKDALKEIESEKNKAVAQLRSQVSAMSVMIASKIIDKQIDEKSNKELIDKYLQEVGGKK